MERCTGRTAAFTEECGTKEFKMVSESWYFQMVFAKLEFFRTTSLLSCSLINRKSRKRSMLLAFSSLNHSSRSWKSTSAWLTQLKTINNSSTESTKMPKEKINSNQIHFYRCKRSPMPHGYPQAITTTLEWAEINTLKWLNNRNFLKLRTMPSQYTPRVLKGLLYKTWQLSIKNQIGMQVCSTARWISMKTCHRVTTITKWTSTTPMIRGTIQFKTHFCHQ